MTHRILESLAAAGFALALCTACKNQAPTSPQPPPPAKSPPEAPAEPLPGVEDPKLPRPELTAGECEARGATVVGDIGDGAIHRPDYVCQSGAAPIGNIVQKPEAPMAIEGAVCCPK